MTVELTTPINLYTVAGIGPYALAWPYTADSVIAVVETAGVYTELVVTTDFSVDPLASSTTGNLWLTPAAAALHAGSRIVILRKTHAEQGWQGLMGEREKGLEEQLDRSVMIAQESNAWFARALRTTAILPMMDWHEGTVPILIGGRPMSGPTATQIVAAQTYATAAAASAAAASAFDGNGLWADDVAPLFASLTFTYTTGQPGSVVAGQYIRTRKEGFSYKVAVLGATDYHKATAGGVLLYVQRDDGGWLNADAFDIAGDNTTEVSAGLQALFSLGGKVRLGRAKLYVINKRVTFPSNFVLDCNQAQIRAQTTGYVRGTTPNMAAMLCPDQVDTLTGLSVTDNVKIIGPGKLVFGADVGMCGLLLGAITNFHVDGLRCDLQAATGFGMGIIVNHAAQNGLIENCGIYNEVTAPTISGACAATRNTSDATAYPSAIVNNITWRHNFMFKNNNTTDEIYWHNGASGVCSNVVHENNHFETGTDSKSPSMCTVYNFEMLGSLVSQARNSIWRGNTFKMRGTGATSYHLLLGYADGIRNVEGVLVEGNTFDISNGAGIYIKSPVKGCRITNNVFSSTSGFAVAVDSAIAGTVDAEVSGNTLRGVYNTAFSYAPVVKDNWCQECTTFAIGPVEVSGNRVDLCHLNLIEHLHPFDCRATDNVVTVAGYASGTVRATFYLGGAGQYTVKRNKVTYNSAESWQILRSAASAGNIIFCDNDFRLGSGAGGVKPSVQMFSTSPRQSGGNYFFDQSEDSAPAFGFGISGYLPQVGHVQYLDTVAPGVGVAYARLRTSAAWRTLSCDVA